LNGASAYRVAIPKDFTNLSLLKDRIACELSEKSITIDVSDQESSFKFLSVTEIKRQIRAVLIKAMGKCYARGEYEKLLGGASISTRFPQRNC